MQPLLDPARIPRHIAIMMNDLSGNQAGVAAMRVKSVRVVRSSCWRRKTRVMPEEPSSMRSPEERRAVCWRMPLMRVPWLLPRSSM